MLVPDISLLLIAPLLIAAVIHRKKGRRWSEPVATVLLAVTVVIIGMALSGGGAPSVVAVPAPMPLLSPLPPPPGCTLPTAPITGTRVISYTYDPLWRLSQAAQSDGACYQYKYDKVGNRTTMTTTAGVTTYGYDAANRLTTAGQMTRAQGITATQVYTYNGDGLLMVRNTSKYVWDQAADLPQMLSDGRVLYVSGVGQWDGQAWTYELPDGLGSVRQLADAQGYLVQHYEYGPFGEMLASEGQRTNSLRYTGEQWDSDVGLLYLRARWYDPSVGRFTTRDPSPGFVGLPRTQNPYVYVSDNPISLTDPSGKIADYLWDAAMIGLDISFLASDYSYYANNPCANSWEKMAVIGADWAALGVDLALFIVPFVPGGMGLGLRLASGGTMALARSGAHVPQVIRIGQGILKGSQIASHIVHSSGKTVGHHTIPRQILKDYLPEEIADAVRGKKGSPNIWDIPEDVHKEIHAGPRGGPYNKRWIEEIERLQKITSETILKMRDQLVNEFGLEQWRPK
jgi:RHS repeat-associated protein